MFVKDNFLKKYKRKKTENTEKLGLIYDLTIEDSQEGKEVMIKMTLTAPGCGMGPVIADEVDRKVNGLEGVENVSVELVW